MQIRASTIIKLGGSLLGLPDLAGRLKNFLGDFSRPRPILICGGGDLVEMIQRWDAMYRLGEESCHWLALRVLSINSRIVCRILPDLLVLVNAPEDCPAVWQRGQVPVFDPYHYIAEIDEVSRNPLPRRWRVTSDSIAASMAVAFGAGELVLLQSIPLPERMSLAEAAEERVVDPHFPLVARNVPRVVSINLRGQGLEESILYDPDSREGL
ncbi:MAG: hypothetical protein JXA90_04425 [Planctomycetes bacterium]|nr:hypothetical protein [Planctomycetota bacterium]